MPLIICQKQSLADVLQKKFLKNFTNFTVKHLCNTSLSSISQKNTCAGVSFPCENGEIFKNTLFYRTPPVAASDLSFVQIPKFQGPYSSVSTVFVTSRYSWYFICYKFRHS